MLTLDHVNDDGAQFRIALYKTNQGRSGQRAYRWIVKNNFPPGFQCLCWNHQWAKQLRAYRNKTNCC